MAFFRRGCRLQPLQAISSSVIWAPHCKLGMSVLIRDFPFPLFSTVRPQRGFCHSALLDELSRLGDSVVLPPRTPSLPPSLPTFRKLGAPCKPLLTNHCDDALHPLLRLLRNPDPKKKAYSTPGFAQLQFVRHSSLSRSLLAFEPSSRDYRKPLVVPPEGARVLHSNGLHAKA